MNNLSSYCGLVDAKIRASDKDLPVLLTTEVSTGCLKGKSNLIWGAIKMKMQYQRSSWFGFHFVVTM